MTRRTIGTAAGCAAGASGWHLAQLPTNGALASLVIFAVSAVIVGLCIARPPARVYLVVWAEAEARIEVDEREVRSDPAS